MLSDAEAFASHCGEVEHDDDFAYETRLEKSGFQIGGPLGRDRNRKYDWMMMFCSWLMMFDDIYVLSIDIFEYFCASICLHEV